MPTYICALTLLALAQVSDADDIQELNPSAEATIAAEPLVTLSSGTISSTERANRYLETLTRVAAANPGLQTTSLEQEMAFEHLIKLLSFSEHVSVCRVVAVAVDSVSCAQSRRARDFKVSTHRHQFVLDRTYLVGLALSGQTAYLSVYGAHTMSSNGRILLDKDTAVSIDGVLE